VPGLDNEIGGPIFWWGCDDRGGWVNAWSLIPVKERRPSEGGLTNDWKTAGDASGDVESAKGGVKRLGNKAGLIQDDENVKREA